ncbi:MAG: oxidoreductase [Desulfobulbus sp.]|nr:MAG: oxidoreductase [Desulfobulbus sp.]
MPGNDVGLRIINMSDRILVTGATGFTGKALCQRLVTEGNKVTAFVRPSSKIKELQNIGVECIPTDITDPVDVNKKVVDFSVIYHIAAAYRTEHATPEMFHLVNVTATGNLLEAAKKNNVGRFVHCSTVGVQGEIDDPPADEEYRFKPGDHYQESKKEGELLARKYFSEGLAGTVFRPVGIYGPGDTRFLKLFKPVSKGMFVMIGSGKVLYHMTFIDDLIDGILLCGSRPEALGEVFTLGGERYTTLQELVDLIAEVLDKSKTGIRIPYAPVYWASVVCDKVCKRIGVSPPLYPRRVEFFSKDRAFSIDKAQRLLGYSPRVSLRDGLARTAAWYREKGLI